MQIGGGAQGILQELEAGDAVRVERDQLAVDDGICLTFSRALAIGL